MHCSKREKLKGKLINSADVSINDASALINLFAFLWNFIIRAEVEGDRERQLSIHALQKLEISPISINKASAQLRFIPIKKSIYIPDLIKRTIIEEKSREIQLADQYHFQC